MTIEDPKDVDSRDGSGPAETLINPGAKSRFGGRAVRTVLSFIVVVIIFVVVLPRFVDFSEVWATLAEMTWLEAATLLLAAAWNLLTYWLLQMVTLPGLSLGQAMVVTETSTAVSNIVPAGQAFGLGLSYSMYSSWGFPRSAIATSLVVSGIADLFAKLALPLVAVGILMFNSQANAALVSASLIGMALLGGGLVLLILGLKSERSARAIGRRLGSVASTLLRLVGREPATGWDEGMAAWRRSTVELLQGRWGKVVGVAIVSHASLFLVLLMALRHVGISGREVSWPEALGAFAVARLLTALPITPGGLGVIELGLTGALVLAGGPEVQVVTAVLIFRALTYLLQIPFGALTYVYWQHNKSWKIPAQSGS